MPTIIEVLFWIVLLVAVAAGLIYLMNKSRTVTGVSEYALDRINGAKY